MSVTRTSKGMCYPGILSDTAPCSIGGRIQFCDSCQCVLGASPKRNLKKFGQSTRLPGCRLGASTSRRLWNAQCGHQAYLLPCQTHLKPHSTLPSLACFAFPREGRASSPEIHRLELGPSAANEKALFMSHRKSMRAPHARALTHICSSLSRVLQPCGISDKGQVVLAQQPVPAPQSGSKLGPSVLESSLQEPDSPESLRRVVRLFSADVIRHRDRGPFCHNHSHRALWVWVRAF